MGCTSRIWLFGIALHLVACGRGGFTAGDGSGSGNTSIATDNDGGSSSGGGGLPPSCDSARPYANRPTLSPDRARFNAPITVTLGADADDPCLGALRYAFGTDALNCNEGAMATPGETVVLNDTRTVRLIACSRAGISSEEVLGTFVYDTSPPLAPALDPPASGFTQSFDATVSNDADDLAFFRYTEGTTAPATCLDGAHLEPGEPLPVLAGADRTFSVVACDEAGNRSTPTLISYSYQYVPVTLDAVSVREPDGRYGEGDRLTIDVQYSDFVTLSPDAAPTLTFEISPTDREAVYLGGSGSAILTFEYVVQPGDSDSDLDYVSSSSFSLNGATLTDPGGQPAPIALPAPGSAGSISATRAIVVDASTLPVSDRCQALSAATAFDAEGSGSAESPFVLCTIAQLRDLASRGVDGAHLIFGGDIDGRGEAALSPIGSADSPFIGVLDGRGYALAHVEIEGTDDVGLFGVIGSSAEVRNVDLYDVRVAGANRVGALAGTNDGTVRQVTVTGIVSATGNTVGGLIGFHRATLSASSSVATVSGEEEVGGAVGTAQNAAISATLAAGEVTATTKAGGLLGFSSNSTLFRVAASGTVTAPGVDAAGLAGYTLGGTVTEAYSAVTVTGTATFVGTRDGGTFERCLDVSELSPGLPIVLGGAGDTTGITSVTLAQLGSSDTLTSLGFDLDEGWKIDARRASLPQLMWERTSVVCRRYHRETQFFAVGSGTAADPYLLCSSPQVHDIADDACRGMTNPPYHDRKDCRAHFRLEDDIDIGDRNFRGIGQRNGGNDFKGVFDGNHYILRNLTMRGGNKRGFFIDLNGVVRDLGLEDVDIIATGHTVGALVAYSPNANDAVIDGCWSTGRIESGDFGVGGLVGSHEAATIRNSWSSAAVIGNSQVGGLVGATADRGGPGHIIASYATGPVRGNTYVGGLVGLVREGSDVFDSYATGEVQVDGIFGGGFAGLMDGNIANNWSSGLVHGAGTGGGFGYDGAAGSFSNNYWNVQTSGQSEHYPGRALPTTAVSGVSTAELEGAAVLDDLTTASSRWVSAATLNALGGPPILSWQTHLAHSPQCWADSRASLSQFDALGSGTPEVPYRLCSGAQWRDLAQNGQAAWGAVFVLDDDLDLANAPNVVVGTHGTPFSGRLDGGGHAVKNFRFIDGATSAAGLIGVADDANLSDLRLRAFVIEASSQVGALLGEGFNTTVSRVSTEGRISGANAVGGMAGDFGGAITDCRGDVVVVAQGPAGGLVGVSTGASITNSHASGMVESSGGLAGGLVGSALSTSTVTASLSAATVSGGNALGNEALSAVDVFYDATRACTACSPTLISGVSPVYDSRALWFRTHPLYGAWSSATWRWSAVSLPRLR